jgi:hypothetical protein
MHASVRSAAVFATASFLLLLSGCATTRSTIDIPVAAGQASSTKAYVKLVSVTDQRRFEATPSEPSVPSLEKAEEMKDPAITARAIARKRGGFGKAMADILLPEGRTVAQVVAEAVTTALRQQGYAVVDEKSPEFARAIPLSVEIRQFWSWFSPGFWAISLEFESIVVLKSEAMFAGKDETVRGYAIVKSMAATDGEWQRSMQEGVADLIDKLTAKIARPEAKMSAR